MPTFLNYRGRHRYPIIQVARTTGATEDRRESPCVGLWLDGERDQQQHAAYERRQESGTANCTATRWADIKRCEPSSTVHDTVAASLQMRARQNTSGARPPLSDAARPSAAFRAPARTTSAGSTSRSRSSRPSRRWEMDGTRRW